MSALLQKNLSINNTNITVATEMLTNLQRMQVLVTDKFYILKWNSKKSNILLCRRFSVFLSYQG